MALTLELLSDDLDVLTAAAVGDQQGVGGVDDDQIVEADRAHQTLGGIDVAIADVVQHGFAIAVVALSIDRRQFTHRLPRADITPAKLARHHGDFVGAFHQRVVDGNVRCQGKRLTVQLDLQLTVAFLARARFQARADGAQDVRRMRAQLAKHGVGAHAEHAGIPEMLTTVQIALGSDRVRFFDKTGDLTGVGIECRAFLDVAKTGFRRGRQDAERHQPALCGQLLCSRHCSGEFRHVGNQVIGRQHQQLRLIAIQLADMQCRSGNRSCRITAERLKDEIQACVALVQLAVVVHRAEIHFPVGHRQQTLDAGQADCTQKGLLQQALAIWQAHERLGHGFTRNRPQACAGASGNDAGNERAHQ